MNSFLLQIVMHTTAESIPAFQNAVSQFHLWWIIMIVQERDFILIVFVWAFTILLQKWICVVFLSCRPNTVTAVSAVN